MKKLICWILVLSMCFGMLSGCKGKDEPKKDDTSNVKEDVKDKDDTKDDSKGNVIDVPDAETVAKWKDSEALDIKDIPYVPTKVVPNVPSYKCKEDLSDIANIDRFVGFSDKQKKALSENGFVVMDQNPDEGVYLEMHNPYETSEYMQIPNFVTVDSCLTLFHVFYDNILKKAELKELNDNLKTMTRDLLNTAKKFYDNEKDEKFKSKLSDAVIFFAVADRLINDNAVKLNDDAEAVVADELKKIEAHTGYHESSLTGRDVNYGQFKPRGHYTGNEELEKYFKAMMWYGLIGFELEGEDGFNFDNAALSMTIDYILFAEESGTAVEKWDRIYNVTNLFVGESDDLTAYNIKDLILTVYGEKADYHHFYNEGFKERLHEEVKKLPSPGIKGRQVTGSTDVPVGKQYRFMGQRFTVDANILQELIEPNIRPVPTALDVAAVLGSDAAYQLVKENHLEDMEESEYADRFNKLKKSVEELSDETWQKNMYNGWLWTLKSLFDFENKNKKGLPPFMQSKQYIYKNISTGLANYAELKHDTILYSKQPMAEMGGPSLELKYPSYVEPNLEIFDKLVWLVKYSRAQLVNYGLYDENNSSDNEWAMANELEEMEDMFTMLRDIAVKELKNVAITEDENAMLIMIGGQMEYINKRLAIEDDEAPKAPSLIADISQVSDTNQCLEIATGFPDEIFVVLNNDGKNYIAKGCVYSFYELLKDGAPLNDEEWHEILGVKKEKYNEYEFETVDVDCFKNSRPSQPYWIYNFKSDEMNEVTSPPIEY